MSARSDIGQAIAEVARDSVPGFDQVGISTLQSDGEVRTRAHTGALWFCVWMSSSTS